MRTLGGQVTDRVRIALDVMGSDLGLEATIGGAAQVSLEDVDIDVILVGDAAQIGLALSRVPHDPARLVVAHAADAIAQEDDPRSVTGRPEASIARAAALVRAGEADALVTAGNTGAMIVAASAAFPRVRGIRRCALAAVFPTARRHGPRGDPFGLMLDVGATVGASAEDLLGFAAMGSAYSSVVSEIAAPRVALLSNGVEAHKGTPAIREAHEQLAKSALAFAGNIEGLDLPKGTVDVVVCDGFLGNVVLKMLEGVGEIAKDLARKAGERSIQWRIGLGMLENALEELFRRTDYKTYGGAPLLGFEAVIIKAHGRSEARAIRNAIRLGAKNVRGRLLERIREGVRGVGMEVSDA